MRKFSFVCGLALCLVLGFGPFLTASYGTMKILDDGIVFPDIKANGSDEPIVVLSSTPVVVSISLDPATLEGQFADWWVVCYGPESVAPSWYSYVHPDGWLQGIEFAVQFGLFPFEAFIVFNKALPAGHYTFYFGLNGPNGQFDIDGPFWGIDSVTVIVEGGNSTSPCTRWSNIGEDPDGRWCDNGNGTVTDLFGYEGKGKGLVWLKDANWGGLRAWRVNAVGKYDDAHTRAGTLSHAMLGKPADLEDGSVEGDWRLPTLEELKALLNGTHPIRFSTPGPFTGVQPNYYWSSTSFGISTTFAWLVGLNLGTVDGATKSTIFYVWPVRSGQ